MSYTIKTNYADKSNYGSYRATSTIKYIVWHYTANDGDTDESNAKFFKSANRKASAHYFVDDDSITISVPDTYVAWSVGGSRYSDYKTTGGASLYKICTNNNSINIELCDTNKNGKYDVTEATLSNAIELTKSLMSKYNIPINNVVRHFDVTGKKCPVYYVDSTTWNNVKKRISGSATTTKTSTSAVKESATTTASYSFTNFVKELQKAIGVTVDGVPGSKTLAATVTLSATKNNKHAAVKPVQKYLNSLGYGCGTADGVAGAKFTKAVKAYQATNGCTSDGEITAKGKTWKKLLKLV